MTNERLARGERRSPGPAPTVTLSDLANLVLLPVWSETAPSLGGLFQCSRPHAYGLVADGRVPSVRLNALHDHGLRPRIRAQIARAGCPSHADDPPSLSLRRTDERVSILCRAGCPTDDAVSTLELGWSELGTSHLPPLRVRPTRYSSGPLGDQAHLLHRIAEERKLEIDPTCCDQRGREFAQVPLPEPAAACRRHPALLRWEQGEQLYDPNESPW
jgi:hypothetical protein